MIADKMKNLVNNSSVIRAMFEEGKLMAKERGADNVYDFSLGNPSVEPPKMVKESIIEELEKSDATYLHGYMSNSGYEDVRTAIAKSINNRFCTNFDENNIIMTVGAAGGLNVILKTIINPEDEVIVFAPFFGEYTNYVNNYDGKLVVIKPSIPSFQPNLDEFKASISPKTKAVIINTPNNPTGVIYSEETIKILAQIMNEKCAEYGTIIYLISDEPYRELVYGDVEVPYITKYYKDTIIGYSYSKSLSLPGERIGYLVIPSEMTYYKEVYEGACVANRILGFVNAPSLIQRAIMKCLDASVDVSVYDKNRIYIYENLSKLGFECVKPEGAFYLFIKAPTGDDKEFVNMAKKYGILIVPGSSFGCPGYARLAYCVDFKKIEGSIEGFRMLANDFGIHK